MARIGIFPGTFDPVHKGHIAFCLSAAAYAGLDSVMLLPEPEPRRKQPRATFAHRWNMIQEALANHPQIDAQALRSQQFTVAETLPELRALFPNEQLVLLLGSDVAQSLRHWPGIRELLQETEIVVGLRGQDTPLHVAEQLAHIRREHGVQAVCTIVSNEYPHLASTHIRSRASTQGLMEPVAAYISQNQLY